MEAVRHHIAGAQERQLVGQRPVRPVGCLAAQAVEQGTVGKLRNRDRVLEHLAGVEADAPGRTEIDRDAPDMRAPGFYRGDADVHVHVIGALKARPRSRLAEPRQIDRQPDARARWRDDLRLVLRPRDRAGIALREHSG